MENATVALANSPIYKLFPAFLAKQLIGGQSLSSIKVFGAWFARLRATGAQLPPLAVLIERLSKYDVTSSEALDTEGASLEDRAAFFQSVLYKDFRATRADAMLAKAALAIGDERIKILDVVIAATSAGEEVNKQAVIARTLFDPSFPMGDRVEYALKDRERAALAAQWQSDAPIGNLEPFTSIDVGLQDVSWASLSAGASLILQYQKAATVANPVLKQVVQYMGDIIAATGASEPKPDVSSFLCEVIGARLGCNHWRTTEPPNTIAWGQQTPVIYKLTTKFVPSKIPWDGSNVHLHSLKQEYDVSLTHAKVVAATGANEALATECAHNKEATKHALAAAPESITATGAAATGAAATGAASADAATSEAEPADATPLADASADDIQSLEEKLVPGAIVLITVIRHKEKYNGFKGKIISVQKRDLKVQMLEGPEKGKHIVQSQSLHLSGRSRISKAAIRRSRSFQARARGGATSEEAEDSGGRVAGRGGDSRLGLK